MKHILRLTSILLILSMLLSPAVLAAPSPWAASEVSGAIDCGLVPEALQQRYQSPISREAVAEIFVRLLEASTHQPIDQILSDRGLTVQETAFPDTGNSNVLACHALGILKGKDGGRFDPKGTLLRAELAAVINRIAHVMGIDTDGYSHGFSDMAGHWASSELGWPVHAGIIKGKENNRFDPNGTLTTQEAIVTVYRAFLVFSSDSSGFEVYFLDVGQADAAFVRCDGHTMLIDGGNVADSSLIYAFLKDQGADYLDYMIATHAHEDHVGGLAGALNYAAVGKAYCSVTSYDSKAFGNAVKYLGNQGKAFSVPSPGDSFLLGSARVTFLGPIRSSGDHNNMSLVLRIVYGNTAFLFTGDAEREEEQDILDAGFSLQSTVLKVGHHGSDSSSGYPFLRAVMPRYSVISVGTGNSYGHPAEGTLSRLRDAGTTVYRTDLQGQIHCVSDGTNVYFDVERNKDADTLVSGDGDTVQPTADPGGIGDYVLNTSTKRFHYPWCTSAGKISAANRMEFTGSRYDLIEAGYVPCKSCNP